MSLDELLAEVLRLPRDERARVAETVLSSLEEPEEEVTTAWAAELLRRSEDSASGRVTGVDWDTARARISAQLAERRARRSSS